MTNLGPALTYEETHCLHDVPYGEYCDRCEEREMPVGVIEPPHSTAPDPFESSWDHVPMRSVLDSPPPEPRYLRGDDGGSALVYPGRDHVLFGPSESGKSWVALITVAQVLASGHRAAIIDFEDDARGVGSRLLALGVDRDKLCSTEWFAYLNPVDPVGPDRSGRLPVGHLALSGLVDWAPELVVIDGVTEAMAIEGLDANSATDVAAWLGLISRRLRAVGSAVVMIDHTAKASASGQPSELGSQHKRAGVNGASFFVEAVRRPGRAVGADPVSGLLRLRLAKDRPGWLRGRHQGDLAAVADIDLTSWPDGGLTWHLLPGGASATAKTDQLAVEVVDYLLVSGGRPGEPGESASAIATGTGRHRTDTAIGGKLTEMVRAGHLTRSRGPRNANLHSLTDAGFEYYCGDDGDG